MPVRLAWLGVLGPGILIAATGVGAGDLLTASLGGSAVGLALLWAAAVGAVLKWFLNEGIARWQMATGTTLLEGWVERLGGWIQWLFLVYLAGWTFFAGGALVTACGVAGTGLLPLSDDLVLSKRIWGVVHSLAGLGLVLAGGFRLFEKVMSVCIAVMFAAVMATVVMIRPDWPAVGRHLAVPSLPEGSTAWVLGVLGGVGGTVTLLSYGYWIREKGRQGLAGVKTCRIDLGVGYLMTALFGIAMIVIGSRVQIEKGPTVAIELAGQLTRSLGTFGKWAFLVGFWGAVFSSLLGVWQGVPYLFADFLALRRGLSRAERESLDFTRTRPYRLHLFVLALAPLPVLWISVRQAQLAYAVLGSLFMPLLAATLLLLNNRAQWVGERFRNGPLANLALGVTLAFFAFVGLRQAFRSLSALWHRAGLG